MNNPKQSSSASGNDVDHTNSTVIFAGDPAQVRAGFLVALQLLGIETPVQTPCTGDRSGQEEPER